MKVLINIDVDDLDKGIRFYTQAFGLKEGRRFGHDFVELLGFPSPLYLLQNAAATATSKYSEELRHYTRHWTPVHLDIAVNCIASTLKNVTEAGGQVESPIKDRPYGKIAQGSDPFGNGFCVIEFSEKGYDALLE